MKYLSIIMFLVLSSYLFAQENAAKDTVTLNEIVVTGTKISTARNQIPFTVSQITQKSIAQSGESALLSVIGECTPGVFITQRGVTGFGISTGSAGQINIRGIGGNPTTEVLVLVNGNPQFAGIFGHPLPDTYLSSDVDKVEIIRGPASILYGSNAMGGVINIITKKETQNGFHLNNQTMYGSFNTSKVMLSSGFRKNDFGINASFNYNRTDGDRPYSEFDLKNGYLKADYTINNHFTAGADFSVSKIKAADPGEQSTGIPGYISDILRTNSNITINDEFENISGAFHVFYNYGENEVTDGFFSIDRNYGLGFYQSLKAFEGNAVTLGFDFKQYGGSAMNKLAMNGKGMGFGDFDVNEKAGYVLVQQSFGDKIVFNAGYRIEDHSVYGVEHVPSVGLAFYVSENTTLKSSVSKGFRSPTIRELYLFTPANSRLEPERVINYELGLMQKLFSNRLGIELTVFKADGDNLIKTVVTGGIPKNVNTGEFSNWGVEFSAKFNQNSRLNYTLNYTFIHMDQPVLSTPEHSLYASINYSISDFRINLGVQNITNLNSRVTPVVSKENYTLVNSMVSYKVFRNLDVFIKAENLLDKKYQINYDYPMPGITFLSGFNFSL